MLRRAIGQGWWIALVPIALLVAPLGVATVAALVICVVSLVVAGVALRRRRDAPRGFVLMYAGALMFIFAILVRAIHAGVSGIDFPYPSPADALVIIAYLLSMAGAISLARARRAFGGQGDALDVLILAVAVAGPFWIGVLDEYFRDDSFTGAHRALSGVYAITEVVFVAVVLRLATGPGLRPRSYWTLAVAITAITLTDALAILDTVGRPGGSLLLPIAAAGFISFAITCRADDINRLVERPPATDPRLTTARLATIGLALAMIPTLVALQHLGSNENPSVTIALVVLLSTLVLIRVIGLLRSRDRIADFDAALRDAGRRLIAVDEITEIAEIVGETLPLIAGESSRSGVILRSSATECVLTANSAGTEAFVTSSGEWDLAHDVATLDARLSPIPDPGVVTRLPLGDRSQQGTLVVVPTQPLEHAQQLALQTLAAQVTMALRSLEIRETIFRRRSEQRLRALVEQSSDVVAVTNGGIITFVSPNAARVMGQPVGQMIGRSPTHFAHPDDIDDLDSHLSRPTSPTEPAQVVEARLATADGEYRWFDITARDFSSDPEVGGTVVTARDVTKERAAKLGLLRSEQWFRGLVQNSSDVIAVLDEGGQFTYVSPAAEHLLGLRPDELRGRNFLELLPQDDPESLIAIRRELAESRPGSRTLEVALERADGELRITEVTITDLRGDPSVKGLVLNIRDITERKQLEEDLRHQVLHDDLTGLGSRVQFTSQLADALGPKRRRGSKVAALFVDVDDFRNINDSLGHEAGDQVLVEISSRLLGRLRLHDRAARFGGDEFAVLLTDVYSEADVTLVADRIVEELSRPVSLMGHEVLLGVSIGIAIDDDGTQSPEDLLRAADVAMYEAKDQGKGRWAIFKSEMADQTLERFEISNALGSAIDDDELMVYYQPILDLSTGRTVGVEALVRWNHPIRGMVNPSSFIPLAERNGLIVPLGRSVLTTAAAQVAQWRRDGHDIYASVNISPVQLQLDGIVAEILQIVDDAGLAREAVVLELTESALINDFELVVARIDALREAGLRVAIDDFGTGYSTLRYAAEFSADILKIDHTFVARLDDNDDSRIVSTVLAIAESMGAETVAEGIELPSQHRRLLALGCRFGQGYYFTRPAPAVTIGETLRREHEGEALAGHAH